MNRAGATGLPEAQVQPFGVMNADAVRMRRRRDDERVATGTDRHRPSPALAVKLHWALRIGVALEFLGHGLAGFYRPPGWIPYFTFFGIPETFAHDYMTYMTGTVDIALAILILIRPMRAVMLHMAVWGLLTALLRPLTGESWFELVERGANYGMPLALLILSGWGGRSLSCWFERAGPPEEIGRELARTLAWISKGSIALLLVGHGGLGIWAAKQEWFDFLGWFGVAESAQAVDVMIWVGVFEVLLGLAVLCRPMRSLLVFVLVWKVGTELLRPLVGQPNYQFVERAGDYVLPLALFWLASTLGRAVPGNGRAISTPEREYESLIAVQAGRAVLIPGVVLAADLGSLSRGIGSPNTRQDSQRHGLVVTCPERKSPAGGTREPAP